MYSCMNYDDREDETLRLLRMIRRQRRYLGRKCSYDSNPLKCYGRLKDQLWALYYLEQLYYKRIAEV